MTQEYYIIAGKTQKGPYDLVALVRKIRNGSLTATTLLQLGATSEPKAAQEWAELAEFFTAKKEERAAPAERGTLQARSLGKALQTGMHFLQRNPFSTLFSGIYVLLIITISAAIMMTVPVTLRPISFMIWFVLGYVLLGCYMLVVLRLTRGQPVDLNYVVTKLGPTGKSMLFSSALISLPAYLGIGLLTSHLPIAALVVGLLVFTIPGLFMMALYAFAPLLILDQGYDFWDAMETSRKAVTKSGMENTGVIYALFVINFLAALCVMIPMAITLPITTAALAEMFDEMFG
jgi:hypothetical protein